MPNLTKNSILKSEGGVVECIEHVKLLHLSLLNFAAPVRIRLEDVIVCISFLRREMCAFLDIGGLFLQTKIAQYYVL